mmetsp:Transcript_1538/g.2332  ORF Transcript_1538/g.2332 Transcript_1538/m.2332 type:complete len:486 (+) Transcript_1538:1156-2613(+)
MMTLVIEQALSSLNSTLSPAPEELVTTAVEVFNSVGVEVQPVNLFEYPPVKELSQNVSKVGSGLPIESRGKLYVALSNAILAPMSKVNSAQDPRWKELFPVYNHIVGTEAQQLVQKVGSFTNPNEDYTNMAQSCRPSLCILTSIANSLVNSEKTKKEFVGSFILPALSPSVYLIGVLLRPAQSDKGKRHVSATLGIARDTLDFMVALLHTFSKQAGAQACQDTVSGLVQLFSVQATTRSLVESGSGGVLLLLKLLRLLAVLMAEPTSLFRKSLPNVLALCFDEIPAAISILVDAQSPKELPESAIDLMEAHFDLLHKVLRQHWKSIFASNVAYMQRAMGLLLTSLQQGHLPPSLFRKNLSILDDLDKTHRLFHAEFFQTNEMRQAFVKCLLNTLVSKSYQILEEELLGTLYGLASVDFDQFFSVLVPEFVSGYVLQVTNTNPPPESIREYVNSSLRRDKDVPSFTRNLHSFSNDCRYYVANNCSI